MKRSLKKVLRGWSASAARFAPVREGIASAVEGLIPVFMLHRMASGTNGGHSEEFVRKALAMLRRGGYRFISLEQVLEGGDARDFRKTVCFTLDDGYADQLERAVPLFLQHDAPVTVFAITGFVDGDIWPWDAKIEYAFGHTVRNRVAVEVRQSRIVYNLEDTSRREALHHFRELCRNLDADELDDAIASLAGGADVELPSMPSSNRYRAMTWSQARDFEKRGVRFAPHSVSHRIMANLDDRHAAWEIEESHRRLAAEVTSPLPAFCFPTGRYGLDFGDRELAMVRRCGLRYALSADPGYVDSRLERRTWLLDRLAFPDNMDELIQYVTGMEHLKEEARRIAKHAIVPVRTGASLAKRALLEKPMVRGLENVQWEGVSRLVFVCQGNICRSPFAEALANRQFPGSISCGVATDRGGGADFVAQAVARKRGVDMASHRTTPISDIVLKKGDLVLAMEPKHAKTIEKTLRDSGAQVSLLGLWGSQPTATISDPFGKTKQAFDSCFDVIEDAVDGVVKKLNATGTERFAGPRRRREVEGV